MLHNNNNNNTESKSYNGVDLFTLSPYFLFKKVFFYFSEEICYERKLYEDDGGGLKYSTIVLVQYSFKMNPPSFPNDIFIPLFKLENVLSERKILIPYSFKVN